MHLADDAIGWLILTLIFVLVSVRAHRHRAENAGTLLGGYFAMFVAAMCMLRAVIGPFG